MSQPAGWYDDPQDTEVLRYWDGVQWTSHTSPRQRPGLDQTSHSRSAEGSAGYGGAGGAASQGYGQGGYGGHGGYGGQGYGGAPGGYQPMPGGDFQQVEGPTTPDGQPIAGWGRRFAARLIDGLVFSILSLILIPVVAPDLFGLFQDWVTVLSDPETATSARATELQQEILAETAGFTLASAVLSLVYEGVFLKLWTATPGKLLLGIRVRRRDQPGPLGWGTSSVRALIWNGPSLLGIVPVLGNFAVLIKLVNGLWPLWDQGNQSLNDKGAKTNVVRKS